jgi:hypothetical protein
MAVSVTFALHTALRMPNHNYRYTGHWSNRTHAVTRMLNIIPLISPTDPCRQALSFHERCLAAGHSTHNPAAQRPEFATSRQALYFI